MLINSEYNTNFFNQVEQSSPEELKQILREKREIRILSGKRVHFWDLNQKKIHQCFDAIYQRGIEKLARSSSSEMRFLSSKIPLHPSFSPMDQKAMEAAKIGLGGFAGWLVGRIYVQSMSNLILHEYGHALAIDAIKVDPHPQVSANAKYWLEQGNWYNWFWGIRKGGPGNWTNFGDPSAALSEFGKWLSPTERGLFVTFAGLGAELAVNSAIAGLGLLAIRRKHRVLGASLLGFSLISHSAAHSYIRRSSELLDHWTKNPGGDPPLIAVDLAALLNSTRVAAFRLLYYGYLFFPLILLGILTFLFMKPAEEIPDECVLMRLLTECSSFELKKMVTELDIEMGFLCERMEELEEKKKQELLLNLCDRLIVKIKKSPDTYKLFANMQQQMSREIKGSFNVTSTLSFRIQAIANIIALVAYQLRYLSLQLVPKISQLINYLAGIFIISQSVSFIIDCTQTIFDLLNKKLSTLLKGISILQTSFSLANLVVISTALFVPGLNTIILPFLIVTALIRFVLFYVYLKESKKVAYSQTKGVVEASSKICIA